MKAGDKVIWTASDGQKYMCEIIAVFKVEDSINKKIIGENVYRIDFNGYDFHVLKDQIEPTK